MVSVKKVLCLLLLVALCLPAVAVAQPPDIVWPTEGWSTSTPEEQGMDSEQLLRMIKLIEGLDLNIHNIVIIRNGYLVAEAAWYPHTTETRHALYSCTKSFTSALVGMAMGQGYLEENVNRPLLDFFPEYTPANMDDSKRTITLEHALTMSAGLSWLFDMDETMGAGKLGSDDWVQFVLDRPVEDTPGTRFTYNSGLSHLLGVLVAESTGQSLLDYAQANLFGPLGITDVQWATDPRSYNTGGFGLALCPRDMAKFGYLYLNRGQWDGQRLIPAEWVEASGRSYIDTRGLPRRYGYQFWVDDKVGYYTAVGYGGQYILVKPDQNLVVVFTSGLEEALSGEPLRLLELFILPAILSDEPLPPNPEANAALQEVIASLAVGPAATEVAPLPEIATTVSGQKYELGKNKYGWRTFEFTFSPGATTAELLANGLLRVIINLDNTYHRNNLPGYGIFLVRGTWTSDQTFSIELIGLGLAQWITLDVTFDEQAAHFLLESVAERDGFQGTPVD